MKCRKNELMIRDESRIDDTYVSNAERFIGDEKIQKMVRTGSGRRGDVLFKPEGFEDASKRRVHRTVNRSLIGVNSP